VIQGPGENAGVIDIGDGDAAIFKMESHNHPSFIEPYLQNRTSLALCLVLVDVNVPPQESDRQLLEFLTSRERPFLIVGTKSDRLSGNQLHNSLQILARYFPQARILPFSARSSAGREELWREIRAAVESHRASPQPFGFAASE